MENNKVSNVINMRDKIVDHVRINGPVLPVKLAKIIGKDITFTGAMMSQLVADKKIMISKGRIGGSPLYYVPGQESKLDKLEQYLNGKQKEAFATLKEKKLLRDRDCEPWLRVALREINDFAIPINVVTEQGNDIFWKWHISKDEEIKLLVSKYLEPVRQEEGVGTKEEIKEVDVVEIKPVEIEKKQISMTKQEILADFVDKPEERKTKSKLKKKKTERPISPGSLDSYLSSKDIDVLSRENNKKGKEVDIIAYIPSKLGKLKYFIAFRDKKKLTETDLEIIHSRAQVRSIPAILLTNGDLTKKARKHLERDYRSITLYRV